ncbi:MAG: FAD-binding oxidoreductase [Sneathiella sp.]
MTNSSNYYVSTANRSVSHPTLRGEQKADICIVGAGFTGLGAALELATIGYSVIVLEAETVGYGASGRSGGQIASGYSPGMIETAEIVGSDIAKKLWEFSELSKQILYGRIQGYNIDCDLGEGELYAAPKRSHVDWLKQEKAFCEENYHYDGYKWIETDELRGMMAGTRYQAALYDREGGHLHPLNYTLGLEAAAAGAGVRVFEKSAVLSVTQNGKSATLMTKGGCVKAEAVILAGNAYLDLFDAGQKKNYIPVRSGILATERLGQERAEALMATKACVCDTYFDLDYFKMTPDTRLVYGGQDLSIGRSNQQNNGIRSAMLKTFPMLKDVRIDFWWDGLIAANRHRLPDVGRIGQRIYYAQGYSGQGVTLSAAISRILAEAISGEMTGFDIFGRIPHRPIRIAKFMHKPAIYSMLLWNKIKDSL